MASGSVHLRLPSDPSAAHRARDAVGSRLGDVLAGPVVEELTLAVSEMVTMVLRTATESTIDVRVAWRPDTVRVEVQDGPAEVRPGMGGQVLTRLSERWGVCATPPAVWAELTTA